MALLYRSTQFVIRVLFVALLQTTHVSAARADEASDAKAAGVLLAGFGFAASVDMLQTSYCLGARTCTEANPLLRGAITRHGAVGGLAIKGAAHTASIYTLVRLRQRSPRSVKWAAVGMLAMQSYVDYRNLREFRRLR